MNEILIGLMGIVVVLLFVVILLQHQTIKEYRRFVETLKGDVKYWQDIVKAARL